MNLADAALAEYGDSSKEATGRRLAAVRLWLGKTQAEMAATVDMTEKVYQHREGARSQLTPDEAWTIYRQFSVDPRFVLFGHIESLGRDWFGVREKLLSLPPPGTLSPRKKGRPRKEQAQSAPRITIIRIYTT